MELLHQLQQQIQQTTVRICTSDKRGHSWECPLRPFIIGINRVKCALLDYHPEHASTINRISTTFLVGLLLLQKNKRSFTVGYLPKNKRMTLDDKQIFSNTNILITSWLQTLAQELTGKEKDFKPFWNSQCLDNSKKLWLPTEIGSVALPLNSSNLSCPNQIPKSSFWIQRMENHQNRNSQRTYYPSFTSTPVDHSVKEDTKVLRTRKIRLYPTKEQKKILTEWAGTYRYVYNQILEYVRTLPEGMVTTKNQSHIREKFINREKPDSELVKCQGVEEDGTPCKSKRRFRASEMGCPRHRPEDYVKQPLEPNDSIPGWTLDTPKEVRNAGLREMKTAFSSAFTNLKRGNIQRFNLGFKRKKSDFSITIPKDTVSFNDEHNLVMYPGFRIKLGDIQISKRQKKKDLPKFGPKPEHDCKVQLKNNNWYLLYPCPVQTKIVTPDKSFCALDPGVRTFQTLYSPEGVIKFQHNRELFKRLRAKLDYLQGLRSRKWIRSNHYKRVRQRIYSKIGWIMDELQYSTIQELKRYKYVLLPNFESQEVVSRNRRLNRVSKRELQCLQHYTFKQRLISSMYLQTATEVHIVSEEYTSKTCTQCGTLNDIGSSEIYRCQACSLVIDRDINGARNILLKHLCSV